MGATHPALTLVVLYAAGRERGTGGGGRVIPELEVVDMRLNQAKAASARPVTSTAMAAQVKVPVGNDELALCPPPASGSKPIFARWLCSPSVSSGEDIPL